MSARIRPFLPPSPCCRRRPHQFTDCAQLRETLQSRTLQLTRTAMDINPTNPPGLDDAAATARRLNIRVAVMVAVVSTFIVVHIVQAQQPLLLVPQPREGRVEREIALARGLDVVGPSDSADAFTARD